MSTPKAVIVPCSGQRLNAEERSLFGKANPFGLILFARNIDNPMQVKALVDEFRACVGRADAPVLIDQEGGRVARLRPPHWEAFPPAGRLGELYRIDPTRGVAAAKLLGRMLASQLSPLGINVDCTPVLDLNVKGADAIIGDRAFGADPKTISALGRAVCDGLRVGGVLPIIKHIPGHGRATADSHIELPRVEATAAVLAESDFVPFDNLCDMPLAMTAHILYPAIDPEHCATLSSKLIDGVIRRQLHFKGLLMSDDICMQALQGALPELSQKVIAAGCDVALVCQNNEKYQPDVKLLAEILEATPALSAAGQERWLRAQEWLRPMELFDPRMARAEFNHLVPGGAA